MEDNKYNFDYDDFDPNKDYKVKNDKVSKSNSRIIYEDHESVRHDSEYQVKQSKKGYEKKLLTGYYESEEHAQHMQRLEDKKQESGYYQSEIHSNVSKLGSIVANENRIESGYYQSEEHAAIASRGGKIGGHIGGKIAKESGTLERAANKSLEVRKLRDEHRNKRVIEIIPDGEFTSKELIEIFYKLGIDKELGLKTSKIVGKILRDTSIVKIVGKSSRYNIYKKI